MSDPRVSIELELSDSGVSEALSGVKSKIQDALSGITFPSIGESLKASIKGLTAPLQTFKKTFQSALTGASTSDMMQGLLKGASDFEKWSFTVSEGINGTINQFYKLRSTIYAFGSNTSSMLGALPDVLDTKIAVAINKLINRFYKLKSATAVAGGVLTHFAKGSGIVDSIFRIRVNLKHLRSSFMNLSIRPGAVLTGLKSIGKALYSTVATVGKLRHALIGASRVLGSFAGSAIKAGGGVLSFAGKLKNAIFSMKTLIAGAGIGAGLYALFDMAKVSEDVERAKWKFDIVFNEIQKKANETAEGIANTFKSNVGSIQSQMARAADVVKPLGLDQDTILEMTRNIALLSQGAEAWTEGRYDAERASTALMKALTGEKEMLKEFGVVITDQEVWDSIRKQGKEMTRANFAISIYNKILERTPDLQKAAFGRIGEFTGRLSQMSEAFKTLRASIGDFIKSIATEMMYLFGVMQRKLAEFLGTEGFQKWKDLAKDIAESIRDIASAIEGMTFQDIGKSLTVIKKEFGTIGADLVNALGKSFVILGEIIASTIGPAITKAIQFGIERASDVTGTSREKAKMYLKHESMLQFNKELPARDRTAGILASNDWGYRGPTRKQVEWARGFLGRETEAQGSPFNRLSSIWGDFSKNIQASSSRLKEALGTSSKASGKDRQDFGGELGYMGPRVPIPDIVARKLEKLGITGRGYDLQLDRLRGSLGEGVAGKKATTTGLVEAWKGMLERAAGTSKDASKATKELEAKIEILEQKKELLSKERNSYLKKMAEKLGRAPTELTVELGYGP